MRPIQIITILLFLAVHEGSAGQFVVGFRVGSNYSMVADKSKGTDAGLLGTAKGWGGSLAFVAHHLLDERFSIGVEPGMAFRRTSLHHAYTESFSFGGSQQVEINNEMHFNYFELPLILSFRIGKGSHIQAGPQYAHLLGGSWMEEWKATGANGFGQPYVDRETTEVDGSKVTGSRSPSEFGFLLGAEHRWPSGLSLALRYLKSFSSVETGDSEFLYGNYQVLTISASYAFIRNKQS